MNSLLNAPDFPRLMHVLVLLIAAALLGGLIGLQREHAGKAAGLRTHMLVSLGTAFFVVTAVDAGLSSDGVSRVIQGLATGIGFLGAGAILKGSDEHEIHGLTTAASIWMAAAVGVAAGAGLVWVALSGATLTLIILSVVGGVEHRMESRRAARKP